MEPSSQLQSYIQASRNSGVAEDVIRNSLVQSGWLAETVDEALKAPAAQHTSSPHRVRNGVLLILSPFIILIGNVIIQVIFRMAGIHSPIINIIAILGGIVGIVMLPLGPILGIMKLSKS
jgi:hypothetical protein